MMFLMAMLVLLISVCMFEAFSVEDYMSSNFTPRLNLVLCMINELFMYSYRGEQLQHESKMISDKIYNSKWYQLNSDNSNRHTLREFKALMQMTLVRADRSIEISAGGFVSMSYDTFLNVSRTYNILSLDLNFWKNFCWVLNFRFSGDEVLLLVDDLHVASSEIKRNLNYFWLWLIWWLKNKKIIVMMLITCCDSMGIIFNVRSFMRIYQIILSIWSWLYEFHIKLRISW